MEQIVSYRLTDTVAWSYHYYAGRQMIGKASSMLSLMSAVRVEFPPVSWYSTFHVDTAVFPGVSRKVLDDRSGQEVFRIVFCEPGFYRILCRNRSLLVEYRDNAYLFGNPGQPVLAVTERIREWPWIPCGEPFFLTTVYEENAPLPAILAFPALRF